MSDYLWDKTGETDAEVERLEKLLGALAHQPRALRLPSDARVEHTARSFRPRATRPAMAVAAALALVFLAGTWLLASRRAADERRTAALSGNMHDLKLMLHKPPNMRQSLNNETKPAELSSRQRSARVMSPERRRRDAVHASAASLKRGRGGGEERAREEAPKRDLLAVVMERQQTAKQQLVYALRLTGAQLSEVQTKVRGAGEERPAPEGRNKIR